MKIKLVFYLSMLCSRVFGLKNIFQNINLNKNSELKNIQMMKTKEEVIYYYEDWSCGEVQWEIPEQDEKYLYTIVIPEKKYMIYFDNNLDMKLESSNNLCVTSGLMKVLYKDLVNPETVITQLQNIDYKHYILKGSLTELFIISFIGFISYGYKSSIKNEMDIINNQRETFNQKPITLQEINDYLKMQKIIKTFVFTLLFILTKNVKMAE